MERETGDTPDRSIHASDVRPGMVVRNPYGGARGRFLVASEPRPRPDGTVEFDTADGRTGRFRPQFRLYFDRAETERLAAERDTNQPCPPGRQPEDWSTPNDHARGRAADYDLDREA
jgi:hypothetical protein